MKIIKLDLKILSTSFFARDQRAFKLCPQVKQRERKGREREREKEKERERKTKKETENDREEREGIEVQGVALRAVRRWLQDVRSRLYKAKRYCVIDFRSS